MIELMAVLAIMGYLQLPTRDAAEYEGFPVPTLMLPPLAVHVMDALAAPLTLLLKVWLVLAVRVGLAGVTADTTTVCGVTVTSTVAASPAALVTVSV